MPLAALLLHATPSLSSRGSLLQSHSAAAVSARTFFTGANANRRWRLADAAERLETVVDGMTVKVVHLFDCTFEPFFDVDERDSVRSRLTGGRALVNDRDNVPSSYTPFHLRQKRLVHLN